MSLLVCGAISINKSNGNISWRVTKKDKCSAPLCSALPIPMPSKFSLLFLRGLYLCIHLSRHLFSVPWLSNNCLVALEFIAMFVRHQWGNKLKRAPWPEAVA